MEKLQQLIEKMSRIYPISLRRFLRISPVLIKQQRFTNGEKVDGSYDIETGEIMLWDPDLNDEEGLILIVAHEWGHKIYHEWLTEDEIKRWLYARSMESIDMGLSQSYPSTKRPEEEFCTLFSLASLAKYWDKNNMKVQAKKLIQKLRRHLPSTTHLIEKCMNNDTKSHKNCRNITHREVESLKKWIHKVIA